MADVTCTDQADRPVQGSRIRHEATRYRDTAWAMSQDSVAIVEVALEAVARDPFRAIDEYWADDVDHRAIEGAVDDRGPIRGKEEFLAYLRDWAEMFDDLSIELVELIDAGEDTVIAVLRASGRAKLSGVETEVTYACLYTIRDGKIARGREYWTREQALEAAQLRR